LRALEVSRILQIPEGVEINLDGRIVTVKGEKGQLKRDFSFAPVQITREGNTLTVKANWARKKEAALVGTVASHIQNMITGVTKGYTCKLKIVFSHFPISVKVQNDKIFIENFTGERGSRIAKKVGDVKITVKGEDIIIQGIDLESVTQTATNIENATKVKRKDPRIFLDGIYVYEKIEGMEQ
jgi:large subunit ribosomal protein L6